MAAPVCFREWNDTTFLKKLNKSSPFCVCGKYVTDVLRGHEMIATKKMPSRMAPRIRYSIKNTVRMLRRVENHIDHV